MSEATSYVAGKSPNADRDTSTHGFAENEDVRLQPVNGCVSAEAGGDRVGLIDQQQCAGGARQLTEPRVKTGLRQYHSAIRHDRLSQHTRDVARFERST
jgi:hypothetical protein